MLRTQARASRDFEGRGLVNKKGTLNTFYRECMLESYFPYLATNEIVQEASAFRYFHKAGLLYKTTINGFKILQEKGQCYLLEKGGRGLEPQGPPRGCVPGI